MKELHDLLKYIKDYVYTEDEERIVILHSPSAHLAEKCYEKAAAVICDGRSDCDDVFYGDAKWHLDIAIDCVRSMDQEDKNYLLQTLDASEHHFGYGMYIRNKYIHSAAKHAYFDADGISGKVIQIIFSILSPRYDYRKEECTGYFGSSRFQSIRKRYAETEPDIFRIVEDELLKDNSSLTAGEAIDMLQKMLLERLGRDEFIRVFKEFIAEYFEPGWDDDRDDWHWEWQLAGMAVLFSIEINQVRCLHALRLFRNIDWGFITSQDECKKFIDENLGLKEEYAQFMAKCAWESCNPFFNGRWKQLAVYKLDLPDEQKQMLSDKGLSTLGDVYDKTPAEIKEIAGLDSKTITKIRKWFKEKNISWK